MEENTTDNAQSKTSRQFPTRNGLGMLGGTGIYGPTKLTDTGTTILPTVAATRGSGAMEGRNAYDYISPWNSGWSTGGIGFGLFGINGTGQRWPGDYFTYRAMMRYPVLALTIAAIESPILAGKWAIECEEDAPKEAEELIRGAIMPARIDFVRPLLRALWLGFSPLELIWDNSDDGWRVPKVRELIPDLTHIDIDDHGQIVQLRNTGAELKSGEFCIYTYGREGDNWYGMPRLENARRTWANVLVAEDKLSRLEGKAAGILPKILYPPEFETITDPAKSHKQQAINAIAALLNGQGLALEYKLPPLDDLVRSPELAKHPLVDVELLDMGNCGPSQEALMKRIDQLQRDLVRSLCRSERTVIEAQTAGSRADAEAHTASIGDTDTDRVHADLTDAVNRWVIKPLLTENFGAKYADSVKLTIREVVDENRSVYQKVLDALLASPMSFAETLERLDMNHLCEQTGLKLRDDAPEWAEMTLPMESAQVQANPAKFSEEPIGDDEDPAEAKAKRDEERANPE